ncbi:hypothetical protein KP79_PYT14183 [Mizuhopecten yessoensis]|uniref:Uncharacterized protein n=1 Tax=Mizuhopecten yessoensis TaxID=6573 RepID=A0A210PE73_MIZYE|nr:hypothetical protein KP79_PYT14183 [Mizuhopecten yessoensis]
MAREWRGICEDSVLSDKEPDSHATSTLECDSDTQSLTCDESDVHKGDIVNDEDQEPDVYAMSTQDCDVDIVSVTDEKPACQVPSTGECDMDIDSVSEDEPDCRTLKTYVGDVKIDSVTDEETDSRAHGTKGWDRNIESETDEEADHSALCAQVCDGNIKSVAEEETYCRTLDTKVCNGNIESETDEETDRSALCAQVCNGNIESETDDKTDCHAHGTQACNGYIESVTDEETGRSELCAQVCNGNIESETDEKTDCHALCTQVYNGNIGLEREEKTDCHAHGTQACNGYIESVTDEETGRSELCAQEYNRDIESVTGEKSDRQTLPRHVSDMDIVSVTDEEADCHALTTEVGNGTIFQADDVSAEGGSLEELEPVNNEYDSGPQAKYRNITKCGVMDSKPHSVIAETTMKEDSVCWGTDTDECTSSKTSAWIINGNPEASAKGTNVSPFADQKNEDSFWFPVTDIPDGFPVREVEMTEVTRFHVSESDSSCIDWSDDKKKSVTTNKRVVPDCDTKIKKELENKTSYPDWDKDSDDYEGSRKDVEDILMLHDHHKRSESISNPDITKRTSGSITPLVTELSDHDQALAIKSSKNKPSEKDDVLDIVGNLTSGSDWDSDGDSEPEKSKTNVTNGKLSPVQGTCSMTLGLNELQMEGTGLVEVKSGSHDSDWDSESEVSRDLGGNMKTQVKDTVQDNAQNAENPKPELNAPARNNEQQTLEELNTGLVKGHTSASDSDWGSDSSSLQNEKRTAVIKRNLSLTDILMPQDDQRKQSARIVVCEAEKKDCPNTPAAKEAPEDAQDVASSSDWDSEDSESKKPESIACNERETTVQEIFLRNNNQETSLMVPSIPTVNYHELDVRKPSVALNGYKSDHGLDPGGVAGTLTVEGQKTASGSDWGSDTDESDDKKGDGTLFHDHRMKESATVLTVTKEKHPALTNNATSDPRIITGSLIELKSSEVKTLVNGKTPRKEPQQSSDSNWDSDSDPSGDQPSAQDHKMKESATILTISKEKHPALTNNDTSDHRNITGSLIELKSSEVKTLVRGKTPRKEPQQSSDSNWDSDSDPSGDQPSAQDHRMKESATVLTITKEKHPALTNNDTSDHRNITGSLIELKSSEVKTLVRGKTPRKEPQQSSDSNWDSDSDPSGDQPSAQDKSMSHDDQRHQLAKLVVTDIEEKALPVVPLAIVNADQGSSVDHIDRMHKDPQFSDELLDMVQKIDFDSDWDSDGESETEKPKSSIYIEKDSTQHANQKSFCDGNADISPRKTVASTVKCNELDAQKLSLATSHKSPEQSEIFGSLPVQCPNSTPVSGWDSDNDDSDNMKAKEAFLEDHRMKESADILSVTEEKHNLVLNNDISDHRNTTGSLSNMLIEHKSPEQRTCIRDNTPREKPHQSSDSNWDSDSDLLEDQPSIEDVSISHDGQGKQIANFAASEIEKQVFPIVPLSIGDHGSAMDHTDGIQKDHQSSEEKPATKEELLELHSFNSDSDWGSDGESEPEKLKISSFIGKESSPQDHKMKESAVILSLTKDKHNSLTNNDISDHTNITGSPSNILIEHKSSEEKTAFKEKTLRGEPKQGSDSNWDSDSDPLEDQPSIQDMSMSIDGQERQLANIAMSDMEGNVPNVPLAVADHGSTAIPTDGTHQIHQCSEKNPTTKDELLDMVQDIDSDFDWDNDEESEAEKPKSSSFIGKDSTQHANQKSFCDDDEESLASSVKYEFDHQKPSLAQNACKSDRRSPGHREITGKLPVKYPNSALLSEGDSDSDDLDDKKWTEALLNDILAHSEDHGRKESSVNAFTNNDTDIGLAAADRYDLENRNGSKIYPNEALDQTALEYKPAAKDQESRDDSFDGDSDGDSEPGKSTPYGKDASAQEFTEKGPDNRRKHSPESNIAGNATKQDIPSPKRISFPEIDESSQYTEEENVVIGGFSKDSKEKQSGCFESNLCDWDSDSTTSDLNEVGNEDHLNTLVRQDTPSYKGCSNEDLTKENKNISKFVAKDEPDKVEIHQSSDPSKDIYYVADTVEVISLIPEQKEKRNAANSPNPESRRASDRDQIEVTLSQKLDESTKYRHNAGIERSDDEDISCIDLMDYNSDLEARSISSVGDFQDDSCAGSSNEEMPTNHALVRSDRLARGIPSIDDFHGYTYETSSDDDRIECNHHEMKRGLLGNKTGVQQNNVSMPDSSGPFQINEDPDTDYVPKTKNSDMAYENDEVRNFPNVRLKDIFVTGKDTETITNSDPVQERGISVLDFNDDSNKLSKAELVEEVDELIFEDNCGTGAQTRPMSKQAPVACISDLDFDEGSRNVTKAKHAEDAKSSDEDFSIPCIYLSDDISGLRNDNNISSDGDFQDYSYESSTDEDILDRKVEVDIASSRKLTYEESSNIDLTKDGHDFLLDPQYDTGPPECNNTYRRIKDVLFAPNLSSDQREIFDGTPTTDTSMRTAMTSNFMTILMKEEDDRNTSHSHLNESNNSKDHDKSPRRDSRDQDNLSPGGALKKSAGLSSDITESHRLEVVSPEKTDDVVGISPFDLGSYLTYCNSGKEQLVQNQYRKDFQPSHDDKIKEESIATEHNNTTIRDENVKRSTLSKRFTTKYLSKKKASVGANVCTTERIIANGDANITDQCQKTPLVRERRYTAKYLARHNTTAPLEPFPRSSDGTPDVRTEQEAGCQDSQPNASHRSRQFTAKYLARRHDQEPLYPAEHLEEDATLRPDGNDGTPDHIEETPKHTVIKNRYFTTKYLSTRPNRGDVKDSPTEATNPDTIRYRKDIPICGSDSGTTGGYNRKEIPRRGTRCSTTDAYHRKETPRRDYDCSDTDAYNRREIPHFATACSTIDTFQRRETPRRGTRCCTDDTYNSIADTHYRTETPYRDTDCINADTYFRKEMPCRSTDYQNPGSYQRRTIV